MIVDRKTVNSNSNVLFEKIVFFVFKVGNLVKIQFTDRPESCPLSDRSPEGFHVGVR